MLNVYNMQYLKIEERFGNNTKDNNYGLSSPKNLLKDLKIYREVLWIIQMLYKKQRSYQEVRI